MKDALDAAVAAAAALGLTLQGLAAGAVGAFISLNFFDGLGTRERWATFVGGWGIGAYGGAPLTALLQLKAGAVLFITLLLALFGMSIAAALIKTIRNVDWSAIVRRRAGGGDPPPPAAPGSQP